MTSEARKEYDIMAARLASMYGAKWDKDAKTRRMVVQAAKVSAWNNAKIKKICAKLKIEDVFFVDENTVRETCMRLSTYRECPLSNILTLCERGLMDGMFWDDFVNLVNKETGAVQGDGE